MELVHERHAMLTQDLFQARRRVRIVLLALLAAEVEADDSSSFDAELDDASA